MIEIHKYTLPNGLRVLHHYDDSTQMVVLNTLYDVGARDEHPEQTGFAHLFEHLMFGGSLHIPDYDTPLQEAGGENNAWTSNDITNYYTLVPKHNVERAFWLESDRMLQLQFSPESLAVQKQVVTEEFKQRNLNQPYGDVYMLLRPLAYQHHPYSWATIGKEIAHIEGATMEQVKAFFYSHYAPNNAILAIAGNIAYDEAIALAEKWYGDIPTREIAPRTYAPEPKQTAPRHLEVERDVPASMLVKAYHMCSRTDVHYHRYDLLSDLLSNGNSSRLYRQLVMEQQQFSEVNAYLTGSVEAGLLIVTGKPMPDITLEEADLAIQAVLQQLVDSPVPQEELDKVVNKVESTLLFNNMGYQELAANLAYHELIGDANDINSEVDRYRIISPLDIQQTAIIAFDKNNCSTLYYRAK